MQSGQGLNRPSQGCRARGLQGVVTASGKVHAANATTWNQGALSTTVEGKLETMDWNDAKKKQRFEKACSSGDGPSK